MHNKEKLNFIEDYKGYKIYKSSMDIAHPYTYKDRDGKFHSWYCNSLHAVKKHIDCRCLGEQVSMDKKRDMANIQWDAISDIKFD